MKVTSDVDGAEDKFKVVRFSSRNAFRVALWLLGVRRPGLGWHGPAHQAP